MTKRIIAGVLLSAMMLGCHAAGIDAADLKWDLSYQAALRAHPIDAREFMSIWSARYPQRQIHDKLAAYDGEPVEASLLIEQPDGHTGDPSATWFIKTRSSAKACSFHPKVKETCVQLEPAKAERFMREVMAFPQRPNQASDQNVIGGEDDAHPVLLNYMGFLSVYVDGKSLQRPIAVSEWRGMGNQQQQGSADAGRLEDALARVRLSDADYAKRQAALDEKTRKDEFAAAIRRGDLRQLERTLDQSPDRGAALLKDDAAPVETAASSGRKATVEFLLKRGASVDANNGAPLKAAVRAGDIAMAELLVWRGANVNRMDRDCGTVYAMAGDAQNGDMQAKLAALGADANAARRCQEARNNGRRGSSEGAETKARAAISNETYQALRSGDYAALEKLYSRLSSDKARTPSGIWGLAVFYRALQSYPQRTTDISYWTREEARAAEWERKFPKSAAAATYHVYVLRDRALSFRGNGYYNEIPKQNIAPMNAAIKEAYALLEKMSSKKGMWDANSYRAKLEVLPYTELFHSHYSYAIESGATMSPDYHEMYFAAALYSLPMWSGAPDGVEQVARLASKGKGVDRDAMYARIYWYLDQSYYHGKIFEDSMADWDDMKTSFDALLKAYPDPWNVNAYAYFACMAKDYRVMASLLQRIGDDLVFSVWGDNGESTYNSCVQNSGADTSNYAADLKARNKRFNEAQYYRMINYASAKRDALQTRESMRALEVAKELERKVWGKSMPGMMTSYNTALTLHDLGRYDDEITALKQGLQSQPGYQMAYYQMGLAYEKLGRKSDAREKFESAAGRPPGDMSSLDKDRRAKEEAMQATMRAKFREYGISAPGY